MCLKAATGGRNDRVLMDFEWMKPDGPSGRGIGPGIKIFLAACLDFYRCDTIISTHSRGVLTMLFFPKIGVLTLKQMESQR